MIALNFLFCGFANAANGAATFFRTLVNNKQAFEEAGFATCFYAQGMQEGEVISRINSSSSGKSKLRSTIFAVSKYSYALCLVAINIFLLKHARRVVAKIEKVDCNQKWLINDIFAAYYLCRKFKDAKNLTLILHNDGDPLSMLLFDYPLLKRWPLRGVTQRRLKTVLSRLDNIIFLSDNAKERFEQSYPDYTTRLNRFVIGNGIELPFKERSSVKGDKIVGVALGTINQRKGYDMLISTLKRLEESGISNLKIRCIGDISDRTIYDRANGVKSVEFLGTQGREEVAQILANADFYIMCSRNEGMPISIIEAMQYSLPIFATNVGAIPQMVTTHCQGVLMQPTEQSIEDTLRKISTSEYDLSQMGENSRVTYDKLYTTDIMIGKYIKTLTEN